MRRIWIWVVALPLMACNPYYFHVNEERPINGHVLSGLHSITHDRTSITLNDSGLVALNRYQLTEYDFTADLNLVRGKGVRVMLRPVVHQFLVDSGLVLNITQDAVTLDSNGRAIAKLRAYGLPLGTPTAFAIHTENNYLQVVLGCDTIMRRFTDLKESDDLVIATMGLSEAIFSHPNWRSIKD